MLRIKYYRLKPPKVSLLVFLAAVAQAYLTATTLNWLTLVEYGREFTGGQLLNEVFSLYGENIFASLFLPFLSLVAALALSSVPYIRKRNWLHHLACWTFSFLAIYYMASFPGSWERIGRVVVLSLYSFWISLGVQRWIGGVR
jgi:hypothetical protein